MGRATLEFRTAAERILVESAMGKRAVAAVPAAIRAVQRFHHVLNTLIGREGFRTLLARAVTLAKAEVPSLIDLRVTQDGELAGLNLVDNRDGKPRFHEGEVVLIANLLGLLVTFIGEALMLRVVKDAWPKARLDDLTFDKGKKS